MDKISHYFFNLELVRPYLPQLFDGFLITLLMAVLTVALGLVLGIALAMLRAFGWRPVNALIVLFIDIFRAIPQLVIIVLIFFALPATGLVLDPITATVVGLGLVLAAFTEERLLDAQTRSLMARIELTVDPEIDANFPGRRAAHVTITTHDGRTGSFLQPTRKGDPEMPLSDAELDDKFMELAGPVLGDSRSRDLLSRLWSLEGARELPDFGA